MYASLIKCHWVQSCFSPNLCCNNSFGHIVLEIVWVSFTYLKFLVPFLEPPELLTSSCCGFHQPTSAEHTVISFWGHRFLSCLPKGSSERPGWWAPKTRDLHCTLQEKINENNGFAMFRLPQPLCRFLVILPFSVVDACVQSSRVKYTAPSWNDSIAQLRIDRPDWCREDAVTVLGVSIRPRPMANTELEQSRHSTCQTFELPASSLQKKDGDLPHFLPS